MKKNFAGQPEGGGQITVLTANDLQFNVNPQPPIFKKQPLFVDNCKNCNMQNFKNVIEEYGYGYADVTPDAAPIPSDKGGGFFSGINLGTILDVGKTGVGIWAQQQQNQSAAEQAQYALQIENQRLQQERERARTEEAKAGSLAGRIKAYGLPIAIGGVVVIAGIAAYFYFKKKKVS